MLFLYRLPVSIHTNSEEKEKMRSKTYLCRLPLTTFNVCELLEFRSFSKTLDISSVITFRLFVASLQKLYSLYCVQSQDLHILD